METRLASMHWVLRVHATHRLVQLRRLPREFVTVLEAVMEVDSVVHAIPPACAAYGLVVDMRSAPDQDDPDLDATMILFYEALQGHVARVAVLVRGHETAASFARTLQQTAPRTIVTESEPAAFEFARGLSATTASVRRRSPAPRRITTPDPLDDALHWATDLEEWARVREKVIEKLDIRAAKRARCLAAELRRAVELSIELTERRELAEAAGRPSSIDCLAPILEELAALRIEAVELMLGGDPPSSRASVDPPPRSGVTERAPSSPSSAFVRALDRAGEKSG